MEEASTQLADTRPVLDKPLRVAIPVNVPTRTAVMNRDHMIYQTTFSPIAINQSYYQFYHNYFKNHSFYTRKPNSSRETSVSMFTPEDTGKFMNITKRFEIQSLPIPSTEDNTTQSIAQQMSSGQDLNQNTALKYDANLKNQLNDYQLLATSSRRANKKDVEAMAYASLGVLHDNQEDYLTSIAYYKQYLGICEELQDNIGVCSAYNCIGLNYMLLVNPLLEKSDIFKNYLLTLHPEHGMDRIAEIAETNPLFSPGKTRSVGGSQSLGGTKHNLAMTGTQSILPLSSDKTSIFSSPPQSNEEKYQRLLKYLHKAIQAHEQHLSLCPDLGGKFIANINLGLCYHWMNHLQQSAFHFQDALRIAIKMQTLFGQSIAVGNLGLLALHKRDFSTARTCLDQHLQLIQALIDPEAEIAAWILLSDLCTSQENYADALDNLEEARKLAEREGCFHDLKRIHCLMGVAKGTLQFAEYCTSLSVV